jgi:hypothetical protein
MINKPKVEETDVAGEQPPKTEKKELESSDTEFKVTVRKLEMPVQPRGVLAE